MKDDEAVRQSLNTTPNTAAAPAVTRLAPLKPLPSLPHGSIGRQVFILSLPMLGEQCANFMVGFVDTWLAGDLSKEATAAVGTATYFTWLISVFFSLVGAGSVALVSRSIGAGDRKQANRVANQALTLGAIIGAVATLVAYAAAPAMAAALTDTPVAEGMCTSYLRIDAFGYVLSSVAAISFAVLRATGDTRTPMYVMIVLNIVNVFVSVALVHGWVTPPMGAAGIAYGTLAARALSGVLVISVMLLRPRLIKIRRLLLVPHWPTIKRILRIGLPASLEAAIMGAAHLTFIMVIARTGAGDASTINYAAHTIAMRMEAIGYLPAFAWATAASTMVGQYVGAQRLHEATRSAHVAALHIICVTASVGLLFVFCAHQIFGMMSNDPAVVAVGAPAFRIMGFIQPILGCAILYTVVLRNVGDTTATAALSIICSLGVRVPLAYLFGVVLGGGLLGAWFGMWADNILKCVLTFTRFKQGRWKELRV